MTDKKIASYFDSTAGRYREKYSWNNPSEWDLMARYLKYLLPLVRNKKTLEVGCGTGAFTSKVAKSSNDTTGVDFSESMVSMAKNADKLSRFLVADALHLPFEDGSFDVVYSIRTLQHIPDYPAALFEMSRVLTIGGIAAFDFMNILNPFGFIRSVLYQPFEDVYLRADRVSYIHQACQNAGLEMLRIYPITLFIDPANTDKYLPDFIAGPVIKICKRMNFELSEDSFWGKFALRLFVICRKSSHSPTRQSEKSMS